MTPRRIVSLVPSLTEALFVLGLGERVVGVTEWCVHPAEGVAPLTKIGGTKNPDIDAVLALRPELVIANREENRRRDVERLEAAGIRVWVTNPRTVRDGIALLGALADLGAPEERRRAVVDSAMLALTRAEQERFEQRVRFVCPIWRDPWMVVGDDTYAHDLITLCGGENLFAGVSERRYPRVTLAEIEAAVDGLSSTYRPWVVPILSALEDLGGKAAPKNVEAHVRDVVGGAVTDGQWGHVLKTGRI